MKTDIWIGLVGVVPEQGNDSLGEGAGGAYVNVLCLAHNEEDFHTKVEGGLKEMGFVIFEFEDVEPLSERLRYSQLEAPLLRVAQEAQRTGKIGVGTFHTFPPDGAD